MASTEGQFSQVKGLDLMVLTLLLSSFFQESPIIFQLPSFYSGCVIFNVSFNGWALDCPDPKTQW